MTPASLLPRSLAQALLFQNSVNILPAALISGLLAFNTQVRRSGLPSGIHGCVLSQERPCSRGGLSCPIESPDAAEGLGGAMAGQRGIGITLWRSTQQHKAVQLASMITGWSELLLFRSGDQAVLGN